MKIRLLTILALFIFALGAKAQKNKFFPGYIINLEGDSLPGIVAMDDAKKWIAWKEGKGKDRILYHPGEMQEFGMGDVRYICATVEVLRNRFPERVHGFLKVIIEGPVELVQYQGETLFGDDAEDMFVRAGDSTLFYRVPKKEKQFSKRMSEYFGANGEISDQIKNGEATYADLPRLVIQFNAWMREQM